MLTIPELRRITALITDHRTCSYCLVPGVARSVTPITLTPTGWVHDTDDKGHDHRARPSSDDAPGSRYGRDVDTWAVYAAAYAYVVGHETATDVADLIAATDHHTVVGEVVNDSPAPAHTLDYHRDMLSRGVIAELGGIRRLRELARD